MGLAPGSTGRGDKLQNPSEMLEPVVHRWAARTLEQCPQVTNACSGDRGKKVSSDQEKTKVSSKTGAPGQAGLATAPQGGPCFIHQCQGNINGMGWTVELQQRRHGLLLKDELGGPQLSATLTFNKPASHIKKRETDSHKGATRELIIAPPCSRELGGAGDGLMVAPGYLEEGLLHSEAGQQN